MIRSQQESTSHVGALRVFLWCVPRSGSTTLGKCFSSIPGTRYWHEPYVNASLNDEVLDQPVSNLNGKRAALKEGINNYHSYVRDMFKDCQQSKLMDQNKFTYPWVQKQLEQEDEDPSVKVIFIKDMGYSIDKSRHYLPQGVRNRHTFLIRNPKQTYPSWKRVVLFSPERIDTLWESTDITDEGAFCLPAKRFYSSLYKFWKYIDGTVESNPIIIDYDDLVANPKLVLERYLESLGIPFRMEYLKWDASRAIIHNWKGSFETVLGGGVDLPFARAMDSSGLDMALPSSRPTHACNITDDLQECIDISMPFYQEMYEKRVK